MTRRRSAVLLPAVLICAVLTTGLTAGVFADWSHTIMPGLGTTDDGVFVEAFQALDRAILGPGFLLVLLGAAVFTGGAAVLAGRCGDRPVRRWATAAFVLYVLAAIVVTMAVHEPLNAVLRDTDGVSDPTALRAAFDESRWATWHLVRTLATTAAVACLARALLLHRPAAPRGDIA